MQLTAAQVEQFERDGYLFFPGLFSADETRVLLPSEDRVDGLA